MRAGCLIAVFLCAAQAYALAVPSAWAEDPATPPVDQPAAAQPAAAEPASASPAPAQPEPSATATASQPDPVVTLIRAKLADPALRKGANADDLAVLEAFYRTRAGGPLWNGTIRRSSCST